MKRNVILTYMRSKAYIRSDEVEEIKDLGVTYDSLLGLLFDKHLSEKVNKAYVILGIIKNKKKF